MEPTILQGLRERIAPRHTALLWLRGTYATAQRYDMAVVGIVSRP